MDGDPADGRSVRVRGDAAGIVAAAVESVDSARIVDGDADAFVVVGEDALLGLAVDPPDAPILPVDDGGGPLVVARDDVRRAVESLVAGTASRVDHPLLSVRLDGEHAGRALADASLVTSEPARISEYAVDADGRRIAGFRADGVVVATPLGSSGYARSAGGPVLATGTGLAVVPIAPFATAFDTWVCRPPVDLSVERDEGPVSLVADGSVVGEVAPHTTVRVDATATVELLVPPAAGDEWKHSNE